MSDYQKEFKRYEKKYLLNPVQYVAFIEAIKPYAKVDQYGLHTIGNIYYDNDAFELIRKSIDQPLYKEKLRTRVYNVDYCNKLVYVELKKKYKGVVYKRRTRLQGESIHGFLYHSDFNTTEDQISREIQWFVRRYAPVPKIYIGYERTAYYGLENADLRMTLDHNIRYRTEDLELSKGHYGESLLHPKTYLLEIKTSGAMPLWLCRILSELYIYPQSFSKVGYCYKEYILKLEDMKGGTIQYA